ncbi:putative tRNA/rRNA methyltransferase YsgA [Nymphon striatum]|nr:putative tRNA/rRNA methyltransferase YsgA [Nymphon striatum]
MRKLKSLCIVTAIGQQQGLPDFPNGLNLNHGATIPFKGVEHTIVSSGSLRGLVQVKSENDQPILSVPGEALGGKSETGFVHEARSTQRAGQDRLCFRISLASAIPVLFEYNQDYYGLNSLIHWSSNSLAKPDQKQKKPAADHSRTKVETNAKPAFVSKKRLKDVCPLVLENMPSNDYALLDSGNGQKLERYGKLKIIRPEAQAIWQPQRSQSEWKDVDAIFTGDTTEEGAGRWAFPKKQLPETWPLSWEGINYLGRFTSFRHVGVFPEQAVHWKFMEEKIKHRVSQGKEFKVLNLFGYTGLASLVAAKAGAHVTHVDASKRAIVWARENQDDADLGDKPIRWICEDAVRFCEREVRRGNFYDGILLDPPAYGRGPKGEQMGGVMSESQSNRPGRIFEITAVSNPRIKSIKALSQKKNRDQDGTFLVEGMKLVRDAFENGWEIETLIYAATTNDNVQVTELAAKLRVAGADILEVNEKVLSSITRRDNPQLVVGVMRQNWKRAPEKISNPSTTWIALDRVRDPGNLGTIIRTADSAGVEGIILVGETTDPFSMEATRASMGSIFNVPLVRMDVPEFLKWRITWEGLVVGTHLEGATDFRNIDYKSAPVLLVDGK